MKIPFSKPYFTGNESSYIESLFAEGIDLAGNGPYTQKCQSWLKQHFESPHVLLTHSCTAALEMAAILADIQPGDEVIMPSFTFVSTANAFVLRGAVPVFVDIRADNLNINETLIESAITPRTKAIVPVHYAGVGCEMEAINHIARAHDLQIIEDAAQGIMATYKGKRLGTFGQTAALSFHSTKNIISGHGGALIINDVKLVERARVLWQKGTNRDAFLEGVVDKYTWTDLGSSFSPNEITAAFLWAQLEAAQEITQRRLAIWNRYHAALEPLERAGKILRPKLASHVQHNAHIYHFLLPDAQIRKQLNNKLNQVGISSTSHYIPLHSSPAGSKFGRAATTMINTDNLSGQLIRLPLWVGIEEHVDFILDTVIEAI